MYTCEQLYPDMPEDILNNIRAFVRNQSASSLKQMMHSNHSIDIALQEAEPILNIINMNNSTIHHNQDSNQTVSNTTHPLDQNTKQNQTVSHTTDDSQNRCTAHTYVKTLNPPLTFITLQPACSAFHLKSNFLHISNNTLKGWDSHQNCKIKCSYFQYIQF